MAKQPRSLTGKVAVITGGGRGIGKALSHALARERVSVTEDDRETEAVNTGSVGKVGSRAVSTWMEKRAWS